MKTKQDAIAADTHPKDPAVVRAEAWLAGSKAAIEAYEEGRRKRERAREITALVLTIIGLGIILSLFI